MGALLGRGAGFRLNHQSTGGGDPLRASSIARDSFRCPGMFHCDLPRVSDAVTSFYRLQGQELEAGGVQRWRSTIRLARFCTLGCKEQKQGAARLHIPDGYLSPSTCAVMYAASAPCWWAALRRTRRKLFGRTLPLLSLFAAFSFVTMMFNLPLPGGTTGHAVGVGIAAIVLGPWAFAAGDFAGADDPGAVFRRRRHHHAGRELLQHGDCGLVCRLGHLPACEPGSSGGFAAEGGCGSAGRLWRDQSFSPAGGD